METGFYFLGIIVLIFGASFLSLKLIEERRKFIESKYKTDVAHFLADLYRLRIKWADRGEMGYVESIDNLIKFHGIIEPTPNKIGGVGLPLTNDALSTDTHLKNLRKEEFKEFATEFIG